MRFAHSLPESAALILAALAVNRPALALDKQGAAHGGTVADGSDPNAFDVEGALTLGTAILNSTYAARPDNTGLALMRYAAHADVDVIGRKLSFPLDVNLFTDRTRRGAAILSPTELDFIGGVTTTNTIFKGGDLELGARVENDRPVDRPGFMQTYADTRARLLYSLAAISPALKRDLIDGDISGALTLGWFSINHTYAARPDNTGNALFRYGAHTELSILHDYLSIGADATMFTDRRASSPLGPSELDLTYEIITHAAPVEVHMAYERDMAVDQSGLVQSFLYVLLVYGFDVLHDSPPPLETRGTILSP
ncbi:MAG: hypothetical protein ABI461_22955 [Polyangiaceae bacterium]